MVAPSEALCLEAWHTNRRKDPLTDTDLTDLTATEAAARTANGDLSARTWSAPASSAWPRSSPSAGLDVSRPRAGSRAGAGCRPVRKEGKGVGPLHGRADRHQGHHRHGRHADRERLPCPQGPAAHSRRSLRHGAASRRRRHHGQDGDDGARHLHARQDAQSAQPGAHARAAPPRARPPPSPPAWCPPRSVRRRSAPSSDPARSAASTDSSRPSASFPAPACSRRRLRSTRWVCMAARWRIWRCSPTPCRAMTRATRQVCSRAVRVCWPPPPRIGRSPPFSRS